MKDSNKFFVFSLGNAMKKHWRFLRLLGILSFCVVILMIYGFTLEKGAVLIVLLSITLQLFILQRIASFFLYRPLHILRFQISWLQARKRHYKKRVGKAGQLSEDEWIDLDSAIQNVQMRLDHVQYIIG